MPSKDEERSKRLAELGVKCEIPTPDGEAKMSAVILQLAEPLLQEHGKTQQQAETVISLTIAAWNKSMFPTDQQQTIEKDQINSFVPKDGSAEAVGVATHIMDTVAEQREKLFPDLRNIIVDYELKFSDGRLTLNVSSAPIPELD